MPVIAYEDIGVAAPDLLLWAKQTAASLPCLPVDDRLGRRPADADVQLLAVARAGERHASVALEIEASIRVVALQREGFHAAIRQGLGPRPGLDSERLFGQPMIVAVGWPSTARRLPGAQPEALAREILAADALIDGRLARLSPVAITHREAQPCHIVYPPGLQAWPPLASFRRWLHDEVRDSLATLEAALTTPARRNPARSTRGPKRPAGWRAPSSRRS